MRIDDSPTRIGVSTPIKQLDASLLRWLERTVLPTLGATPDHALRIVQAGTSPRVFHCAVVGGRCQIRRFVVKVAPEACSPGPLLHEIAMHRLLRDHFEALGRPDIVPARLASHSGTPLAVAFERVEGVDLAGFLKAAARGEAGPDAVLHALRGVASLLAMLHAVPGVGVPLRRPAPTEYAERLLRQAHDANVTSPAQLAEAKKALATRLPALEPRTRTVVHGDANATNFMLTASGATAIDFERVGRYDPGLDLGFLTAEILHLVRQYGGRASRATRLARTFLDCYQRCSVVKLEPDLGVYLAMGLWRVARNLWIPAAHRRGLVALADMALRGELSLLRRTEGASGAAMPVDDRGRE